MTVREAKQVRRTPQLVFEPLFGFGGVGVFSPASFGRHTCFRRCGVVSLKHIGRFFDRR
ncbi:hypothetical protein [Belnapia rosea]|uniref:hypothetical protein n=1 Tax=Belnapia rosea TaxID=938405 RepID=UPI000881576C|nr:hypothetical protein [Belnapia rosea]SDB74783.1 hypothetical protein SAMN02927895_05485 [Belnapia rosea]